jgi:hypothetical protein
MSVVGHASSAVAAVNRPRHATGQAIEQLVGADLIRCYEHRGYHYAFIPRFRQRSTRDAEESTTTGRLTDRRFDAGKIPTIKWT